MEKRTPHCKLKLVKALVEAGKVRTTHSARAGADETFTLAAGGCMSTAYDVDFIGWLDHQAKLLRAHNHDELDYDNLAEEVEVMSRSQRRELKNRYTVLLMHLLKWKHQPDYRCTSWRSTIFQQRLKIKRLIRDMPSIKNEFNDAEWQVDAWDDAVTEASAETSIFKENFPKNSIWTVEQVLSDWLPD